MGRTRGDLFRLWLGDMPALPKACLEQVVRFCAHNGGSLERNILGFVGFAPIHQTLIGSVDSLGAEGVARWLKKLGKLGERAA